MDSNPLSVFDVVTNPNNPQWPMTTTIEVSCWSILGLSNQPGLHIAFQLPWMAGRWIVEVSLTWIGRYKIRTSDSNSWPWICELGCTKHRIRTPPHKGQNKDTDPRGCEVGSAVQTYWIQRVDSKLKAGTNLTNHAPQPFFSTAGCCQNKTCCKLFALIILAIRFLQSFASIQIISQLSNPSIHTDTKWKSSVAVWRFYRLPLWFKRSLQSNHLRWLAEEGEDFALCISWMNDWLWNSLHNQIVITYCSI